MQWQLGRRLWFRLRLNLRLTVGIELLFWLLAGVFRDQGVLINIAVIAAVVNELDIERRGRL